MFFADSEGAFAAERTSDGRLLWSRHLNAPVRASPMTYLASGRQLVALAAGKNVVAFALP